MSELEDRINSVLNDPEQMEKITKMARSFMGGGSPEGNSGTDNKEETDMLGGLGIDAASLQKLGRMLSRGTGQKPQERALLEAMKPYLSEKRRSKMDKAIKLARLAKIAQLAMGEIGGDGDD